MGGGLGNAGNQRPSTAPAKRPGSSRGGFGTKEGLTGARAGRHAQETIHETYDPETMDDDEPSVENDQISSQSEEEDQETKIQRLEKELFDMKEENGDLRRDLTRFEDKIAELERDKESAERTIRLLKVENQSLNAFIELNKGGDGLLKSGSTSRPATAALSRPGTGVRPSSSKGDLEGGSVSQVPALQEITQDQNLVSQEEPQDDHQVLVHAYLDEIYRLKRLLEKKGISPEADSDCEDSNSKSSEPKEQPTKPRKKPIASKADSQDGEMKAPSLSDLKAQEGLDEKEIIKKKQ